MKLTLTTKDGQVYKIDATVTPSYPIVKLLPNLKKINSVLRLFTGCTIRVEDT